MSHEKHQKVEFFCLQNRLLFEVSYCSRWAIVRVGMVHCIPCFYLGTISTNSKLTGPVATAADVKNTHCHMKVCYDYSLLSIDMNTTVI